MTSRSRCICKLSQLLLLRLISLLSALYNFHAFHIGSRLIHRKTFWSALPQCLPLFLPLHVQISVSIGFMQLSRHYDCQHKSPVLRHISICTERCSVLEIMRLLVMSMYLLATSIEVRSLPEVCSFRLYVEVLAMHFVISQHVKFFLAHMLSYPK